MQVNDLAYFRQVFLFQQIDLDCSSIFSALSEFKRCVLEVEERCLRTSEKPLLHRRLRQEQDISDSISRCGDPWGNSSAGLGPHNAWYLSTVLVTTSLLWSFVTLFN